MLGGGNPVGGSNPTGIGSILNYVGNHVYAYSGPVDVPTSETTLIDFVTGNNYIVAKFQPAFISNTSDDTQFDVKINGELITRIHITSATATTPYEEIELIIGANTRVEITCTSANTTRTCAAMLTGRVY